MRKEAMGRNPSRADYNQKAREQILAHTPRHINEAVITIERAKTNPNPSPESPFQKLLSASTC